MPVSGVATIIDLKNKLKSIESINPGTQVNI